MRSSRISHAVLFAFALLTSGALTAAEITQSPVVYMIGDSTMADKPQPDKNPERGWGQLLPEFVAEGVVVENHAAGGRSTRSFIAEDRWNPVLEKLQPGDWVIIQFGHNDQKKKRPDLYTDPASDFPQFLERFVRESRAKGAKPVLATSIYRRYFHADGSPKSSLVPYATATQSVAKTLEVPVVDLHTLTGALLAEFGVEGSKTLFLHFAPGEHPFFPNGHQDNSHLSELGARRVAELFVRDMARQDIGFPARPITDH